MVCATASMISLANVEGRGIASSRTGSCPVRNLCFGPVGANPNQGLAFVLYRRGWRYHYNP